MARSDGRPNSHIQEKPSPKEGDSARLPAEQGPAVAEGRQRGWRWAATLWAVVFLFLTALMLFDLAANLVHR